MITLSLTQLFTVLCILSLPATCLYFQLTTKDPDPIAPDVVEQEDGTFKLYRYEPHSSWVRTARDWYDRVVVNYKIVDGDPLVLSAQRTRYHYPFMFGFGDDKLRFTHEDCADEVGANWFPK